MKAIEIENPGPDSRLNWVDRAEPGIGAEEVLVEIRSAGINRADLMQRAGNYPVPPGASSVLGLEAAGEIVECGSDVEGWQPGDRVMALIPGGGYATRMSVPSGMLMRVPDNWSWEMAAAFPEAFYTSYLNLVIEGGLVAGETVLIHGGASGIGTVASQIAHFIGARVMTTAGSDEKTALSRTLGSSLAINYRTTDMVASVKEATDGDGVDVILDVVGADYLSRNLEMLKVGGRLVVIGLLGGSSAEIDLRYLMAKRLKMIGSVLRARPVEEKIRIRNRMMEQLGDGIVSGAIGPVLDRSWPIEEVEEAHQYMRENRTMGKVVLVVKNEE